MSLNPVAQDMLQGEPEQSDIDEDFENDICPMGDHDELFWYHDEDDPEVFITMPKPYGTPNLLSLPPELLTKICHYIVCSLQ